MIEFEDKEPVIAEMRKPSIKVLGVGGAGGNAINSMVESGCDGVEFIAINTDSQALCLSKAENTLQLGVKSTKGMGTGANPELGKRAAEEDLDKIMAYFEDADIVFLTAGLGGGTGSGALPVVARVLKEKGVLSIAIVTTPFNFEGKRRDRVARQALEALEKEVDTLIVIPNQKLIDVVDEQVSMIDAFAMVNQMLNQSVKSIADIIGTAGHINVDFADIRAIMKGKGLALMGSGYASGQNRAREAVEQAISFPLLEYQSIAGAQGVLLNITGGKDLGIHELNEAASVLYAQVDDDASIVVGSVIDESVSDGLYVTVVATGINPRDVDGVVQAQSIRPSVHDNSEVLHESPLVHDQIEDIADELVCQEVEHKEPEAEHEEVDELQADSQVSEELEAKGEEPQEEQALESPEPQRSAINLGVHELVDMSSLDVPTALRIKQQAQIKEITE